MTLDSQSIGRTLGELRKARGKTQHEVAAATELTVNYLSLLENGQRGASIEVINKLATAFNIPAEFILFLAGDGKADGKAGEFRELFKATKEAIRALIEVDTKASKYPPFPDNS